ncbi:MAG: 4Fe-4S dicluster domain-containing protein, partial [Armatimonadia bacterium]|nr:4Fe-4S dicluster domain-containing protein [Armatimonadia bacterium]
MKEALRRQLRAVAGTVFDVDETATHDGPGLRMAVYLKGCPLSCLWCHSPESIRPDPQIVRYQTRCSECGACLEVCPEGLRALSDQAGSDPGKCRQCLACVSACP